MSLSGGQMVRPGEASFLRSGGEPKSTTTKGRGLLRNIRFESQDRDGAQWAWYSPALCAKGKPLGAGTSGGRTGRLTAKRMLLAAQWASSWLRRWAQNSRSSLGRSALAGRRAPVRRCAQNPALLGEHLLSARHGSQLPGSTLTGP